MTRGPIIPAALKRVSIELKPMQEAAAEFHVNYTARQDTVTVSINPDLAPPDLQDAYRIKAAVMAALEPFARYRRAVTRELGSRPSHEALYAEAVDKAMYELQQLIHHTGQTGVPMPELGSTLAPAPLAAGLPDSFPWVAFLRAGKVFTDQQLTEATDAELLVILTPEQLADVRSAQAASSPAGGPVAQQGAPLPLSEPSGASSEAEQTLTAEALPPAEPVASEPKAKQQQPAQPKPRGSSRQSVKEATR